MEKVYKRVIEQTINAVQYNGTNLEEIYNFINNYRANVNEITFEELKASCRPKEIPLDVNSTLLYNQMKVEFDKKWKYETASWRSFLNCNPYADIEQEKPLHFPPKYFEELKVLDAYRLDWKKGEEYHFYITAEDDGYCRLVGLCKNDWLIYGLEDNTVDIMSDKYFNSYMEYNGWTPQNN